MVCIYPIDQVKVFFSKARIQSQEDTLLTINLVVSGIFRENFTCNLTFTSMTASKLSVKYLFSILISYISLLHLI